MWAAWRSPCNPRQRPRLCRAAGAGANTRVLAAQAALAALRGHPLAKALLDHHRLGCLVCAFDTPDGLVPEFPSTRLFQRRFGRGPGAAGGVDRLYSALVYLHR